MFVSDVLVSVYLIITVSISMLELHNAVQFVSLYGCYLHVWWAVSDLVVGHPVSAVSDDVHRPIQLSTLTMTRRTVRPLVALNVERERTNANFVARC